MRAAQPRPHRPLPALSAVSLAALAAVAMAACGAPSTAPDGSIPLDANARDDSDAHATPDADTVPPDAAADPTLVAVESAREIRGAWIPSVYNIVFPSSASRTPAQGRAEIVAILDVMAELRMNAAFVQIRPESDALYQSSIEPWSRFLTGTQGEDPGWDPLAAWIEEGHARGIEIHAWINPYRGMTSSSVTTAPSHVTRTLSEHALPYGALVWMDPGAPEVRAHVVSVVRDVVSRYAIDGIHFDDYFYPYPNEARDPFPDDASWDAYRDGGGTITDRGDWRRDNVHQLVRAVSEAIAAERDDVRFGISPFGIYRPGMPPGITGLDAYAAIYCDPLRWIEEGWVDYLAPQLYWPTTQAAQDFDLLIEWWAGHAAEGRTIVAGTNLVKLGDTSAWTLDEFRAQMAAVASFGDRGVSGSIAYHVAPFLQDRDGVRDVYRDEIWTAPALTPPLASADPGARPPPPALTREGSTLRIDHSDRSSLRAFALYVAPASGPLSLARILPASADTLALDAGETAALSAVDRRGVESLARRAPAD